jgi:hypothetical protein
MKASVQKENRQVNSVGGTIMSNTHATAKREDVAENIRKAALAKYKDVNDACVRNGIQRWDKEYCETVRREAFGELVHEIVSPEMQALAIAYHEADIEENIAIERAKLAKAERLSAGARFQTGLARHEGVYAQEDDVNIVISRMEVRRIDKNALQKHIYRKVVEFAKFVADGSEADWENVAAGRLPGPLQDLKLLGSFPKDIVEYLRDSGPEGVGIIRRICEDEEFARWLWQEKQAPNAVLFLVYKVLENSQTSIKNCMTNGSRRVGFASVA